MFYDTKTSVIIVTNCSILILLPLSSAFDTFLLDAVLLEWQENLVGTKHIIPTLLASFLPY